MTSPCRLAKPKRWHSLHPGSSVLFYGYHVRGCHAVGDETRSIVGRARLMTKEHLGSRRIPTLRYRASGCRHGATSTELRWNCSVTPRTSRERQWLPWRSSYRGCHVLATATAVGRQSLRCQWGIPAYLTVSAG